ncbi:hypothetical protein E2C01_045954 [Portunus trituberculatus]|uniref:Uncharacterized protein n=1 Tax=Portunus trituberculatus TaxID=210409 RepID=A0A5B7G6C2_PORTR|nr:hypothetical protein [Portunus trituberculatus]
MLRFGVNAAAMARRCTDCTLHVLNGGVLLYCTGKILSQLHYLRLIDVDDCLGCKGIEGKEPVLAVAGDNADMLEHALKSTVTFLSEDGFFQ